MQTAEWHWETPGSDPDGAVDLPPWRTEAAQDRPGGLPVVPQRKTSPISVTNLAEMEGVGSSEATSSQRVIGNFRNQVRWCLANCRV